MLIARNWAYFRAWALFRVGLFTEFYGIFSFVESPSTVQGSEAKSGSNEDCVDS